METVEITDELTLETFSNVSGTTYTEDTGKDKSSAVYNVQMAGGNSSIQLRTNKSNSGIVTTVSGGKVKRITLDWNSATSTNRTLDVYGKSEAYTSPSDLFNANKQGTKIGSIGRSETSLTVDGDYEYIGLRSNDGAVYIKKITIVWEITGNVEPPFCFSASTATATLGENFEEPTLPAYYKDKNVIYSCNPFGIAEVNETTGKVTLVAAGTTTITATLETSEEPLTASYELTVKEKAQEPEPISCLADTLTANLFKATSSSYNDFSDVHVKSDALYAGNSANNKGAIQLRSSNSNSGIVTTKSGGKVKAIIVKWNTGTISGRQLDIYGKSTAYSSAANLYATGSNTEQGTNIGSFTYDGSKTTATLEFEEANKFEYIGLRSKSGAMYLDEITVVWETEETSTPTSATLNFVAQNAEGYYATFSSDKDVVFTNDVVVYAANVNGTAVKLNALEEDLHEVTDATAGESGLLDGYYVPANTGVLVYSADETTTYYFPAETAEVQLPANMLEAATADGVFEGKDGYCYYKLAYNDYTSKTDLGFYYGAADGAPFAVKKGLAYLAVPTTSGAAPARFVLGGDTDAISSVNSDVEKAATVIYTIAGQRVDTAAKPGLYIVNGKKLIVK